MLTHVNRLRTWETFCFMFCYIVHIPSRLYRDDLSLEVTSTQLEVTSTRLEVTSTRLLGRGNVRKWNATLMLAITLGKLWVVIL